MILGIDQPTMELIITPYNGIQYSGAIGGGSFSKLAVKLPNLITLRFAAVSFYTRPKALSSALSGAFEAVDAFTIASACWSGIAKACSDRSKRTGYRSCPGII
jgi:hypothetical protein